MAHEFDNYRFSVFSFELVRYFYIFYIEFSYRSKTLSVKSRIDFFLISKHLTKFVKKVDIQTSIAPDHNIILLSLSWPNENPRGPGFWKFNNSKF